MGGPIPDERQRVSAHRDSIPGGLRHSGDSAGIYHLQQPEGEWGHRMGHAHAQRSVSLAAGMDPFLRVDDDDRERNCLLTEHYLHSALGYKPPRQFEREYYTSHGTQFTAA
jgi:hypothetical protein